MPSASTKASTSPGKCPRSVESLRLITSTSQPARVRAFSRLAPISPASASAAAAVKLREFVKMKKALVRPANSLAMASTDQVVSTGTPCTVWVPVGSSSSTTILRPEDALRVRMSARRLVGHSGGRFARVSVFDRVADIFKSI